MARLAKKKLVKTPSPKTKKKRAGKGAASQYEANLALQEYESMFVNIKGFVYAAVIKKGNAWLIELAVQNLKAVPEALPSVLIPNTISHASVPPKIRIRRVKRPSIALLYSGKYRPAAGAESVGVSTSASDKTGTLGYALTVVTKNGPTDFIITNWHVLLYDGSVGDSVIQPGPQDRGNKNTDIIAEVTWGQFDGTVDVALAEIKDSKNINLLKIKGANNTYLTIKGTASAVLNNRLWAACWKTDGWSGLVRSLNATTTVTLPDGTTKTFRNQIQIENKVLGLVPGDSGSAVTDVNNKVVGIIFAGGGSLVFANKIEEIDKAIKNANL